MAIQMAPIVLASMAKFGLKYLTKPKYKKPDTGYLDRHSANLRSDIASKDTYHTTMRAVLKNIGRESGKLQRTMDYDTALRGEDDSGVNIQKRISAHGKTVSAIKDASIQASEMQAAEDRRFHDQLDEVMLIKEKILADAKHRYGLEEDQWKKEMLVEGASGALNIGMGAFQQAGEWKNAFDTAKMNNADLTMEAFKGMGGTPETAMAKFGHDLGKGQTSSYFSLIGKSIEKIKTAFDNNVINESQARELINSKLKSMNEDPNMLEIQKYDKTGSFTVEKIPNLEDDKYPDTLKKKVIKPEKIKTQWGIDYAQGKNIEYNTSTGEPTGEWYPYHEKPREISASEQKAIQTMEGEQKAAIYSMGDEIEYRKRANIGNIKELDKINSMMIGGISEDEVPEAYLTLNDYIMSIGDTDLNKLSGIDEEKFNEFKKTEGQGMEELMAYREFLRRVFNRKMVIFIKKIPHDPEKENTSEGLSWTPQ